MQRQLVHVLGASGAGTTTFGRALGREFDLRNLDTDDYFWIPSDPPYTVVRPPEERTRLLARDLEPGGRYVVSGSLCGWGDFIIPKLTLAVWLIVPTDVRIGRLLCREYERFGERIRPGGDMHAEHIEFIEWAKTYDTAPETQRSSSMHESWVGRLACPVLRLDGAMPAGSLIEAVRAYIR